MLLHSIWNRLSTAQRRIVLFIGVGIICSAIDIGIFAVMVWQDISTITSAITSFLIANVVNYYLSSLVFANGQRHTTASAGFFTMIIMIGVVFTWTVMSAWETYVGVHPIIAKLIAGTGVMIWGYFGRQFLVFRNPSVKGK